MSRTARETASHRDTDRRAHPTQSAPSRQDAASSRARALALALLVGCGPSAATPASETTSSRTTSSTSSTSSSTSRADGTVHAGRRPLDARERAALDGLIAATEQARDLTFVAPVRAFVESPEAIEAHASTLLDDEELEKTSLLYGGLGLLPPELDLRAHFLALLGEQVLGYYDSERVFLVLRDEVAHVLATRPGSPSALDARLVVVHELTHALQAQRLRLAELQQQERDSDPEVALHALVEGDAMLAMLVDLSTKLGVPVARLVTDDAIDELAANAASGGGDALEAAPPIVRVSLVAPYVAGLRFVRTLHARGGWRAVDVAFAQLPASTAQVLHPELYLRGEAPEAIELPPFPSLDAAGFSAVDEDTLGELDLSVFLARGTPRDTHPGAAEGWTGDRVRLYRRGDAAAIVWLVRFRDGREAIEAEAELRRIAVPNERFRRRDRALLVLRHVPEDAAREVEAWFDASVGAPSPHATQAAR